MVFVNSVFNRLFQWSHTFAAAFLMPAEKVEKLYKEKEGNISALAEAFNVSLSAMNWRCINLQLKQA